MNPRRTFLGALVGLLAGVFARPATAAAALHENRRRDHKRVFRLRPTFETVVGDVQYRGRKWTECRPQDIKKGDWQLLIDIDEGKGTVTEISISQASSDWEPDETPHGLAYLFPGTSLNLLDNVMRDHIVEHDVPPSIWVPETQPRREA